MIDETERKNLLDSIERFLTEEVPMGLNTDNEIANLDAIVSQMIALKFPRMYGPRVGVVIADVTQGQLVCAIVPRGSPAVVQLIASDSA